MKHFFTVAIMAIAGHLIAQNDRVINTAGGSGFDVEVNGANPTTIASGDVIDLVNGIGTAASGSAGTYSFDLSINSLTEEASPADNDYVAIWDVTGTVHRKVQLGALVQAGGTGTSSGGIYGGDGYLIENTRASGGASQYAMKFDSVGIFEIHDWNTGQALRVWQDINAGAGKAFGRMLTLTNGSDSLEIDYTDGVVFDVNATKQIHFYTEGTKLFGNNFNIDFVDGIISDLRGTKTGLVYIADYSANYTNRSLVDKEYCDGNGAGTTGHAELVGSDSNTAISTSPVQINATTLNGANLTGEWTYDATNDELDYSGSAGVKYMVILNIAANTSSPTYFAAVVRQNTTSTSIIAQVDMINTSTVYHCGSSGILTMSSSNSINVALYKIAGNDATIDIDNIKLTLVKLPGQ